MPKKELRPEDYRFIELRIRAEREKGLEDKQIYVELRNEFSAMSLNKFCKSKSVSEDVKSVFERQNKKDTLQMMRELKVTTGIRKPKNDTDWKEMNDHVHREMKRGQDVYYILENLIVNEKLVGEEYTEFILKYAAPDIKRALKERSEMSKEEERHWKEMKQELEEKAGPTYQRIIYDRITKTIRDALANKKSVDFAFLDLASNEETSHIIENTEELKKYYENAPPDIQKEIDKRGILRVGKIVPKEEIEKAKLADEAKRVFSSAGRAIKDTGRLLVAETKKRKAVRGEVKKDFKDIVKGATRFFDIFYKKLEGIPDAVGKFAEEGRKRRKETLEFILKKERVPKKPKAKEEYIPKRERKGYYSVLLNNLGNKIKEKANNVYQKVKGFVEESRKRRREARVKPKYHPEEVAGIKPEELFTESLVDTMAQRIKKGNFSYQQFYKKLKKDKWEDKHIQALWKVSKERAEEGVSFEGFKKVGDYLKKDLEKTIDDAKKVGNYFKEGYRRTIEDLKYDVSRKEREKRKKGFVEDAKRLGKAGLAGLKGVGAGIYQGFKAGKYVVGEGVKLGWKVVKPGFKIAGDLVDRVEENYEKIERKLKAIRPHYVLFSLFILAVILFSLTTPSTTTFILFTPENNQLNYKVLFGTILLILAIYITHKETKTP